MQWLAVASTKGGSGKSTLAACLGVEASLHFEKVAIIDLDAQQSLSRWHELRVQEIGITDKPALVPTGAQLVNTLAKAAAGSWDLVVIDCPPGNVRLTAQGIEHADFVLIPTRASPLDVEAIDVMVELCEQCGKPFAFVLNATAARAPGMTAGARKYLSAKGDVLDVEIGNRIAYASAMILGGTGPDKDKAAKAEIASLWAAVEKRLARAHKLASKSRVAP